MHIPRWFVPAVLIITVAVVAFAGPLDPPPGPITSTYKTLSEVQPRQAVQSLPGSVAAMFVISQPGSYYLTAPIFGIAGKAGIEIAASDVSLDLSGFPITGTAGSTDGIRITGDRSGVRVEHGAVRGWPGIGVNLAIGRAGFVRDIVVTQCGTGILGGASAQVQSCTAEFNSVNGISGGEAARVQNCTSNWNGGLGFYLSEGATADACISFHNSAHGYYLDGDGCSVLRSTARSNGGSGIMSIYTCTVDTCTSEINAVSGIVAAAGSVVRSCTAQLNDQGGIVAGAGTTVTASTARSNSRFGISITEYGRVENCTCSENRGFKQGPGAGILVTGPGSRVEGNTLTVNDVGLMASAPGNVIVRNTASGNTTNFNLIAGQTAGPIITGPAGLTTTSPWANFEH